MAPSDNSCGNKDFKSGNEFEGNTDQNKLLDRASESDIWSPPSMGKMWSMPHWSLKDKRKSFSAIIAEKWNKAVNQYCFDKNSLYNALTSLCTLVISLPISLLNQLFELSDVLRIQLLLSSPIICTYQLFSRMNVKAVKILVSLKHEICDLSSSIRGKRKTRFPGDKA